MDQLQEISLARRFVEILLLILTVFLLWFGFVSFSSSFIQEMIRFIRSEVLFSRNANEAKPEVTSLRSAIKLSLEVYGTV